MSTQVRTINTSSGGILGNLRIGPKIIVGYLLLIVLMAGVAGVAYWGINRITEAYSTAVQRETDAGRLWAMQMYMLEQYANQADLSSMVIRPPLTPFRSVWRRWMK